MSHRPLHLASNAAENGPSKVWDRGAGLSPRNAGTIAGRISTPCGADGAEVDKLAIIAPEKKHIVVTWGVSHCNTASGIAPFLVQPRIRRKYSRLLFARCNTLLEPLCNVPCCGFLQSSQRNLPCSLRVLHSVDVILAGYFKIPYKDTFSS